MRTSENNDYEKLVFEAEFGGESSRGWRILDAARVVRTLEATSNITSGEFPNESQE